MVSTGKPGNLLPGKIKFLPTITENLRHFEIARGESLESLNIPTQSALEGLRVLDLSHVLAAPTTTMFLADLGAEVIHIEPLHGDDARGYGPFVREPDKNRSGYFISLNRNKKSMVLNLKLDKGRDIFRELIRVSDVVVENFRPTAMKKMGLGWEDRS